ncbi:hypothetical protein Tco_0296137 [Tanacetum coccineum]
MVFHNEDGNPARANIKQALGRYERPHKGVKASANSDIIYFFTSARDSDPLQDDVKIDDPNITIEEYIRLEEEKARRHSRMFNWQTVTFWKIENYEDEDDCFIDFETEFPAIVFDNTALPSEPTVCPPNENKVDFRISLDESDDEDYTNVLRFNDLFNIIRPDDLKSEKDNDDNDINIIQSLEGNETTPGANELSETRQSCWKGEERDDGKDSSARKADMLCWHGRLEDKQPEEKTNTDCLVKEQEKEYHTGWKIKMGNVLDSYNQSSTQQCMRSVVTKYLGIAGISSRMVLMRQHGTGSIQVLHGFEVEVEPLGDHTFDVEPQENVNQGAGLQEAKILVTKGLLYITNGNVLGRTIVRDQSGNTLRTNHMVIESYKWYQSQVGPSGGVDGVPSVRPRFDGISGSRIVAIVEGEAHGALGLRGGLLGVQTQSHIGKIIISKLTYKLGGLLLLSPIGFRMEPQLGLYVRLGEILGLRFPTIGIRARTIAHYYIGQLLRQNLCLDQDDRADCTL